METDKFINFLTQGYEFASTAIDKIRKALLTKWYVVNRFYPKIYEICKTLCRAKWISRMDDTIYGGLF
jgi:hypothetical protein